MADADFHPLDIESPFDINAYVDATPKSASTRGMFLNDLLRDLRDAGHPADSFPPSYVAFKNYPLTEYAALAKYAATTFYNGQTLRSALWRLGLQIYPRFAESMVGKSIFAIAGNRFDRMVRVCVKAYEVSQTPGVVRILSLDENSAHVEFRNFWMFTDTVQVGNWQGAMLSAGVKGEVLIKSHSLCDMEFKARWDTPR